MPDAMKPTVEQLLKHHVLGQCAARILWDEAKKKAKHVDTGLFNQHLGPALDALNDVVHGAQEVKKYYPQLDDRTLGPIKKQKEKCDHIISEYKKICDREGAKNGLTDQQKQEWHDLRSKLDTTAAAPGNMTRAILR